MIGAEFTQLGDFRFATILRIATAWVEQAPWWGVAWVGYIPFHDDAFFFGSRVGAWHGGHQGLSLIHIFPINKLIAKKIKNPNSKLTPNATPIHGVAGTPIFNTNTPNKNAGTVCNTP